MSSSSATRRSNTNTNTKTKTSSSVPVPVPAPGKPFCKVCYDVGLPVADYTDHYVKDQPGPGGKVVCPTLLAQKCFKCGVAGHTSSYCPEEVRRDTERKEREHEAKRLNANDVKAWKVVGGASAGAGAGAGAKLSAPVAPAPAHVANASVSVVRGSFGLLAVDSGDESEHEREQEEVRNTPAGVPKPVAKERPVLTGPPPAVEPAKPLTWAQRAAAAATKSSSTPSSAPVPAPVQTSIADTRFHLHSLCHQIEVSRRAPSAKKVAAAAAANHRGNAAAGARESSLKRKQDSVTIPA